MNKLKKRSEIAEKDKWDLSSLFKDEQEFEDTIKSIDIKIEALNKYKGKLNNAKNIKEYFEESNKVALEISNIFNYAHLRRVEDMGNSEAQERFSRSQSKYVKLLSACAFAEPEILEMSEDQLNKLVDDELLQDYKYYLTCLIKKKKHTLSCEEESILAKFKEVFENPENVSETLRNADISFDDIQDSEGNTYSVNESSYISLQRSNNQEVRKLAFDSYYKTYKQFINTFASLYSGYLKMHLVESKLRGYNSSREMSMSEDDIPETVYDNLINTVHSRMDLMYRYVKLRKRILKLDELHYYDLYAPLVKNDNKSYSYDEAKEMVLSAVEPLGDEYVGRVKQAFADRWIDVYPNIGKESGAFSSGTYTSNPFIKMNFDGTLDNVSTLAHEMGHSQHSWLTNHNQPIHYADYTMFVAEVASTVNENLLIEQLLEKESDPEKRLGLLNQYLEGFKGTVYRQTMFAEFEKITHEMVAEGKGISADSLNEVYLDLIKLYFGKDLIIDDAVKYEWARIPHFYYFFYVYVYATGYSAATAISEKILNNEKDAVKNYLEFLSMGNSESPLEELKHAGVDLTTSKPINIALDKFEKVLDEAEKIADELGL